MSHQNKPKEQKKICPLCFGKGPARVPAIKAESVKWDCGNVLLEASPPGQKGALFLQKRDEAVHAFRMSVGKTVLSVSDGLGVEGVHVAVEGQPGVPPLCPLRASGQCKTGGVALLGEGGSLAHSLW